MKRLAGLLVAVVFVATGCSDSQDDTTSSDTSNVQVQAVTGTVNLEQYELAPPEIPAQQQPQINEGQAVKRPNGEDAFYKHDDEVVVVCRTWGEEYPDPTNMAAGRHDWYEIEVTHLVPGYLQAIFVDIPEPVSDCPAAT